MVSVIILALTALSAPVAAQRNIKCRTDQPRCPNENMCTTTTANGAVLELRCNTDYNGDIIQSTQAGSFADCARSCAWVPNCTAFNYKAEFCYLLGKVPGTARTSNIVAAGVLTKAGIIPSSKGTPCSDVVDCDVPGTSGCTYNSNVGSFKTSCNTDYYGNDMAISFSHDLSGCMANCASTAGCKAVSWSTGTCYLKNGMSSPIFSQWVDGAYLQ